MLAGAIALRQSAASDSSKKAVSALADLSPLHPSCSRAGGITDKTTSEQGRVALKSIPTLALVGLQASHPSCRGRICPRCIRHGWVGPAYTATALRRLAWPLAAKRRARDAGIAVTPSTRTLIATTPPPLSPAPEIDPPRGLRVPSRARATRRALGRVAARAVTTARLGLGGVVRGRDCAQVRCKRGEAVVVDAQQVAVAVVTA